MGCVPGFNLIWCFITSVLPRASPSRGTASLCFNSKDTKCCSRSGRVIDLRWFRNFLPKSKSSCSEQTLIVSSLFLECHLLSWLGVHRLEIAVIVYLSSALCLYSGYLSLILLFFPPSILYTPESISIPLTLTSGCDITSMSSFTPFYSNFTLLIVMDYNSVHSITRLLAICKDSLEQSTLVSPLKSI